MLEKNHKNLFIIPGWMKSVSFYGNYNGLDIWKKDFDLTTKIDTKNIVSHSAGTIFALVNWNLNPNKKIKLILINPLLPQKNFLQWFFSWLRFAFKGKIRIDKTMGIKQLFPAIKNFSALLKFNPLAIAEKIPKENLTIIRGANDKFFCNDKVAEIIRNNDIKLIEIEGLGHEWNEKFFDAIRDVI